MGLREEHWHRGQEQASVGLREEHWHRGQEQASVGQHWREDHNLASVGAWEVHWYGDQVQASALQERLGHLLEEVCLCRTEARAQWTLRLVCTVEELK